eukprot:TRINITY_DN1376_c0_g1_i5.p1 TRINITY_DN1376_c0_g1~~TRINITY_DN1376_c0_g1_i5.p1  ORF type:complete len:513 (-),score=25.97 TRINITY_DN1376_c0_g1_i5:95-1633(-)
METIQDLVKAQNLLQQQSDVNLIGYNIYKVIKPSCVTKPVTKIMEKKKSHINIALIGHASCGKSTTAGHIFYKCATASTTDTAAMELVQKTALDTTTGIINYAWIFDLLKAERERGISIDICLRDLPGAYSHITLVDTPGIFDFVKNTISGVCTSDAVLMVVSAVHDEFEAGIAKSGQTQSHALIAHTMGIKNVIVAVSKMDLAGWSQERFEAIQKDMTALLGEFGFNLSGIAFVPISGLLGDNILEPSPKMSWYKGPTIVDVIGVIDVPPKPVESPLRICLEDVYNIAGIGAVPVGRVESGILRKGMIVTFAPGGIKGEVTRVEKSHEEVQEGFPGDNVAFSVKGVSAKDIRRGFVCGESMNNPPCEAVTFEAKVAVMNHPGKIMTGYTPVVDCHKAHIACKFEELKYKIERDTDKILQQAPESLQAGDCAIVKIRPTKPMCVEIFNQHPTLGRRTIRDMRKMYWNNHQCGKEGIDPVDFSRNKLKDGNLFSETTRLQLVTISGRIFLTYV